MPQNLRVDCHMEPSRPAFSLCTLAAVCALIVACGGAERARSDAAHEHPAARAEPELRAHLLSLDTLQITGATFSRLPDERRLYVTNLGKGKLWSYVLDGLRRPTEPEQTPVPHRSILRGAERYFYVTPAVSIHLGGGRGLLAAGAESSLETCCQVELLTPQARGFAHEENLIVRPGPGGFSSTHAADFDGDGRVDLVAVQQVPSYQRPGATSDVPDAFVHLFLGGPRDLVPKDVLDMKNTDVLATRPVDLGGNGRFELPFLVPGREVSVIEYKGGGLSRRKLIALAPDTSWNFFDFGDVDGDHSVDFLVSYTTKASPFGLCCDVYLGDGRGGFGKRQRAEVGPPNAPVAVFQPLSRLIDLDGDGRDELLTRRGRDLEAWSHRKDGRFESRIVRFDDPSGRFLSDRDPQSCKVYDVYDFDDDGDLDMSCGERSQSAQYDVRGEPGPAQSPLFLLENLRARAEPIAGTHPRR